MPDPSNDSKGMTMAETPKAQQKDTVHFDHYCEHEGCKRWGAIGYSHGKAEVRWWCGEHYPHWGDRRPAN